MCWYCNVKPQNGSIALHCEICGQTQLQPNSSSFSQFLEFLAKYQRQLQWLCFGITYKCKRQTWDWNQTVGAMAFPKPWWCRKGKQNDWVDDSQVYWGQSKGLGRKFASHVLCIAVGATFRFKIFGELLGRPVRGLLDLERESWEGEDTDKGRLKMSTTAYLENLDQKQ